ncbi:MAG: ribosome assembly RNA-binding protein YhbY [Ruminococcaceae bacterium]|nr:ribosome assembly RNA-binding protein YhbY [Oscillospiraceae bacterium]
MITSKQRAYLRGLANGIDPIFQIGKSGITDILLSQLADALEARELIKVHILETALLETKTAANEVAKALNAEPIQAIGAKFVLYKQAKNVKNRKIELPRK